MLGAILNVGLLIGVLYIAIASGGMSQLDTIIAGVVSIAWLVIGFAYLYIRQITRGVRILHPEDHKEKLKEQGISIGSSSD